VASEKTAETGGIESRARAQNAPGGNAAIGSVSSGQVRHHVNRIGGNDKNGIRRALKHCRHHLSKDLSVSLEKLQTSFSWFLPDPGARKTTRHPVSSS
jgi:hypothetical protein